MNLTGFRKNRIIKLIFLCVIILLLGMFKTIYASAEAKNEKNIAPVALFFGDSIIEQWEVMHPEFFTENKYLALGKSGETTTEIRERFNQELDCHEPHFIILEGGINDIAENGGTYEFDITFQNIKYMADKSAERGVQVIICSLLPCDEIYWRKSVKNVKEKVCALNEKIKELADSQGYLYLDFYTGMKDDRGGLSDNYAKDAVHPNLNGYKKMEEILQSALIN